LGSSYDVIGYFGIAMKVMTREDMFANKIVAMYERLGRTNRDISDVCFFLHKNWPINRAIVEKRTNLPFKEFLADCIKKFEKLIDRTVLSGMGELLDSKKKAWVKDKLKAETLFYLKVLHGHEKS
jgi:hypothetical protein